MARLPPPISFSPHAPPLLQTQYALLASARDEVHEKFSSLLLSIPLTSSAPSALLPSDQFPRTSSATNYHPHIAPHSKTVATSPPARLNSIQFLASNPPDASATLLLLMPTPASSALSRPGLSTKSCSFSK